MVRSKNNQVTETENSFNGCTIIREKRQVQRRRIVIFLCCNISQFWIQLNSFSHINVQFSQYCPQGRQNLLCSPICIREIHTVFNLKIKTFRSSSFRYVLKLQGGRIRNELRAALYFYGSSTDVQGVTITRCYRQKCITVCNALPCLTISKNLEVYCSQFTLEKCFSCAHTSSPG